MSLSLSSSLTVVFSTATVIKTAPTVGGGEKNYALSKYYISSTTSNVTTVEGIPFLFCGESYFTDKVST